MWGYDYFLFYRTYIICVLIFYLVVIPSLFGDLEYQLNLILLPPLLFLLPRSEFFAVQLLHSV